MQCRWPIICCILNSSHWFNCRIVSSYMIIGELFQILRAFRYETGGSVFNQSAGFPISIRLTGIMVNCSWLVGKGSAEAPPWQMLFFRCVEALLLFDVWTIESRRPNPSGSRRLGHCAADYLFYDDWTCNISFVGNIGCCITTLLARRSTVDSDSHTIELHTRQICAREWRLFGVTTVWPYIFDT